MERIYRSGVCSECHGTGFTCSTCGLGGHRCKCSDAKQEALDCQTCQGEGTEDTLLCPKCEGGLTSTDLEAGECTHCEQSLAGY